MNLRPYISGAVFALTVALFTPPAARGADQGAAQVQYSVEITGAGNGVESLMRQSSQLLSLQNRPPPTQRALRRRLNGDMTRFRAVLESEGFYGGQVESQIDFTDERAVVRIKVMPGPRYTVASVELQIDRSSQDIGAEILETRSYESHLSEVIGIAARAEEVIAAESAAIEELQNHGFPFAASGEREVIVDHEAKTISIVLPVQLGAYVMFGSTRFSGLESVEETYLQELVPWEPGEEFSNGAMEDYRRKLVTSGLFTSVRVSSAEEEDLSDNDNLGVDIALDEAAHRTIGAGAKYSRDRGFGGSVFWEHRNLLGQAERLRLSLDGTELDQTATADFRKPNFLSPNQTLILGSEVRHADTEAFREWSGSVSAALERELARHWTVSAGTSLEIASLTEDGVTRTSYLAGLPLLAIYDTSNDILDPTEGWNVSLGVTPYAGSFDGSVAFVKTEAEGNVYVPFNESRSIVFATRLAVGSIAGAATDHVPANRRFYAGGGGSVRGFGYQLVGPLDASNEPTGGRSLIEAAVETRFRVTESIGVVPFFDAGVVSQSSLPGEGGKLRMAAGLGGRYYTAVGPLRLDIAIPINRRPGVDKAWQFYISFGQAF